MMKKNIIILLLLFLNLTSIFAIDFFAPDNVKQGCVVTVMMKPGSDYENTEVELLQDSNVYSRTMVFRSEVDGNHVDIALLGVPSTLDPGKYSITVTGKSSERKTKSITVKPEDFVSEDIPLTRSMSNLRQSDDERKAIEWRNLLIILKTVDTEHVYEAGSLEMPIDDFIWRSSFFGDRRRYLYDDGTSARSIHNGVDYSAEPGTPIYASGKGRVVFSGERIISGNTIVIEHLPGVYSLYYHCKSLSVKENEMVDAGDLIATVGSTGLVTGAHLHWEVRVAGVAVSPEPLISGAIIDKAFIMSKINAQ